MCFSFLFNIVCILWLEFSQKGEIPSFFATYLRSLLCRTQVRRRLREHKLSLAPLSPPCSLKPFGGRLHPYTPSRVLLALNDGGDNSGKSQITPIAFRAFCIFLYLFNIVCILWLEFSQKGEIPSFFATYLRSLLCRTQVRRRLREHKLSLAPLSPPCSLKPFGGKITSVHAFACTLSFERSVATKHRLLFSRACHDFGNFLSNCALSCSVVLKSKLIKHFLGVFACRIHCVLSCDYLTGKAFLN